MEIRNAYISCSHPLLINFENTKLFDSLGPDQRYELPIEMRLCIEGHINIKFLIRYEVGSEDYPAASRFRF